MANTLTFDARGRLTIPQHLRKGLGERVVAIRTPHGVVLHPVPAHVTMRASASGISGEDAAADEAK